METNDLIKVLSADAVLPQGSFRRAWAAAIIPAVIVAAIVFLAFIGPRVDIAAAAETLRFLFKFVVTGLLAMTAIPLLIALARPEPVSGRRLAALAAAPILLLAAVVLELFAVPSADWGTRLVGVNIRYCLTFIPLVGAAPLALFILALRRAAPSRPLLAGAVAGIAAGGIAATFYAAHCTDDSPLFVATWYTLAISALTIVGGFAGKVFARW